jgi:predicted kinase
MRTLILLRGLPGSGKSSFATFIWDKHVVFEADKYFYDKEGNYNFDMSKLGAAHKWCQLQVEHAMEDNQANPQFYPEIVVSNTSTTESELKPYLDLAAKYDYKVVSLIVENRHGNGEETNIHGVGKETLDKMENRLRNSIKLR